MSKKEVLKRKGNPDQNCNVDQNPDNVVVKKSKIITLTHVYVVSLTEFDACGNETEDISSIHKTINGANTAAALMADDMDIEYEYPNNNIDLFIANDFN